MTVIINSLLWTSELPHVLVIDEAFALSRHLLKPYAKKNLDNKKKRKFNYWLSHVMHLIKCPFGLLANKLRISKTTLQSSLENAELAIQACLVLHNIIHDKEGINLEEEEFSLPSYVITECNQATHIHIATRENVFLTIPSRRGSLAVYLWKSTNLVFVYWFFNQRKNNCLWLYMSNCCLNTV